MRLDVIFQQSFHRIADCEMENDPIYKKRSVYAQRTLN